MNSNEGLKDLDCPFCGKKPRILDTAFLCCKTKKCVLYNRSFTRCSWNTRATPSNEPSQPSSEMCCCNTANKKGIDCPIHTPTKTMGGDEFTLNDARKWLDEYWTGDWAEGCDDENLVALVNNLSKGFHRDVPKKGRE